MRRRLSRTMEKREGLQFSGLCFGNCYWGQWGGSKAGGEHVGRGNAAKGHECEENRWIEVSKSVIHRSTQTGWEMGRGVWASSSGSEGEEQHLLPACSSTRSV